MFLFGFLILQFYSGSIVGSLLMEKPARIKTLRQLIDSELKLGIEDIIYNRDYFKVNDLMLPNKSFNYLNEYRKPMTKHLWNYLKRKSNFMTNIQNSNGQIFINQLLE